MVIKDRYDCPLELAMALAGGKWKLVMLWHLRDATLRFSELKRKMPQITQKMLTQLLRELEDKELVTRKVYAVVPPKVEYTITELGYGLMPALTLLCDWAKGYAFTHDIKATCGGDKGVSDL